MLPGRAIAAARMLRGWVAAFVWPGPCLICRADLPAAAIGGVCAPCWTNLPRHIGPACPRCDLPFTGTIPGAVCPDCRAAASREPLERAIAALIYSGPAVDLHRLMKFDGQSELVRPCAARMALAWRLRGQACDVVAPVPFDPWRFGPRRLLARRLARAIARDLHVPAATSALRKVRSTRSQTTASGRERRARLDGAFQGDARALAGRRVLVIDDVMTTGATLREAARASAAAGAVSVAALVLARTPLPADRAAWFAAFPPRG